MGTETPQSERARPEVFERAHELANALMDPGFAARREPLRDLILAGLEAGGMRHAQDSNALRAAAGELAAAALDARRHA
jgi:hypothetical protein